MTDYIDRQAAIDAMNTRLEAVKLKWRGKVKKGEIAMYLDMRGVIETLPSAEVEPVVHYIDCIPDEIAQKIIEEAKSLKLRHCNKLGWAYCCGKCNNCSMAVTIRGEVENNG